MRPLPTVDYPDKTEGVTLKCTRFQEAVSFFLFASVKQFTDGLVASV